MSDSNLSPTAPPAATLLWDYQDSMPLSTILSEEDLLVLLTPAVIPLPTTSGITSDPFEPLGKALAQRHPWIRHVPYTKDLGITGTHAAFIKRAKVIIFVLTELSPIKGVCQPDLAEVVREVCDERPMIVVACCDINDHDIQEFGFPTLVHSNGFSITDLKAISTVLLDGQALPTSIGLPSPSMPHSPTAWSVLPWDFGRDITEIHLLWIASLPTQFHLPQSTFASLLKRDGYAMHLVVRDPHSNDIVGFCATFTTFADSSADRLIGSIAAIVVREDFRCRGIGRVLHDEACSRLNKVRGVSRIQLGSTFPRLLYGIPSHIASTTWFENRGWTLDKSAPGKGRISTDWLLRFTECRTPELSTAGLKFRPCQIYDIQEVRDLASRESEKKFCFGWYDQYARTLDSRHVEDVIVGFEGETLVATAITYVANGESPVAEDIPWATSLGSKTGGVACICVKDDDPDMANRRESVLSRLLQMCRQSLSERGMDSVFIDGAKLDEKTFFSLGYHKLVDYKEVWRET
ncbi:hypothetical protein G7046_g1336 [Stylonectria norvegica]|nr:hypothetical protein G7046_g1336 [Stylonectria norvegica]